MEKYDAIPRKRNFPFIIALLAPMVAGCAGRAATDQKPLPVAVNVATVRPERVAFYDDYPGTVVALNKVELRSEVSGFITGIFFREGETVASGQKLYEIDRSRYQATYDQAKANVEIAAANVVKAQRYADTYAKLNEQDAIARQRFDDAQTDLQNARLELASAKAGLVKAATDLNRAVITSPFAGTIGLSQVKLGTLVNPGQTLLNTISSDNPIGVDFTINESDLGQFQKLLTLKTFPGDSTFRISLPDNTIYSKNGKIEVIDRAIDPQTGTVTVRLVFPNPGRSLRDGMSCDVHVLHADTAKQLVIPSKALMEEMSEYFVYLVDSQKVKQTRITLGARVTGSVVVMSGLQAGQQVVTDGIQKLRNGAWVSVEPAKPTRN